MTTNNVNASSVPIIEEPVQFQYNSDFPILDAKPPAEFPPANPSPCARITTRVFDVNTGKVETVPNVLVKTMMPAQLSSATTDSMDEDSSSSSSDDDDDSIIRPDDKDIAMDVSNTTSTASEECAYWMQRTVREAIYGRVLYAIVLKRRPRTAEPMAEWELTRHKCAIKEMSWQHIRKERDRLAEDPIKEVSAMQYLQKFFQEINNNTTDNNEDFFRPIMETNIMMPLDLLSDDRHLYSIMPYCDGGELFDRLDLNERFSEEEARYWMHQVLNVSGCL